MKLTNEEIQKIEQLLRDSSYAKYHKRLQIIYFRSKEKSYSHLVLKKHSNDSKILGTSFNKSVTFFFKTAQACSMGFKSGE